VRPFEALKYTVRYARTRHLAAIVRSGAEGARDMTELRCQRGAQIARIAVSVGDVLGLGPRELRDLRRMALLHDIGKLGVSNLILDKPGKLTDEEWTQMRRHPERTVRILERVSAFQYLAATAGAHHERLDGRGYHLGLRDEHLSRDARILAVADACEALPADRAHRKAMEPEQVRAIMRGDAGKAFCHDALGALELGRVGPMIATPVLAAAPRAAR